MGLENLKSVFEDDLTDSIDDFSSNIIISRNGTQLFDSPPQPTRFIATNPTDFSTAVGNNELPFTPLNLPFDPQGEPGGKSFLEGLSWEKLYNDDHTPKDKVEHKGVTAQSYTNVNRDNLKIGKKTDGVQRYGFDRGDEPYVISKIGDSGRNKNAGGRSIPIIRALADGDRIINYLASADGLAFVAKQNINVVIENTVIKKNGSLMRVPQRYGAIYNPLSTVLATSGRLLGQGIPNVLFRKQGSGAIAEVLRGWEQFKPGGSAAGGDANREALADLLTQNVYGASATSAGFSINDTFTKHGNEGGTGGGGFGAQLQSALSSLNPFDAGTIVPKQITGDKMTLSSMVTGESLDEIGEEDDFFGGDEFEVLPVDVDAEKDGIPFYFKDLRDNTYILFRAYIEGLTENISPSYASHNYIGRSEPVWTYERAEREISMTIKLVAQTQSELVKIYEKMDRLTSLCYPEYVEDTYGNRMKPPLTKFRYGELFGKTNKEQLGYIKSISYSVEESSPYETDPEVGRVPRHVNATIGYQVIHEKAPRLDKPGSPGTKFYGINQ